MKFSGSTNRLVKLHRPPPDISIFLPGLFDFSSTRTCLPRWAAVSAHIKPAAPAPRMMTSKLFAGWTMQVVPVKVSAQNSKLIFFNCIFKLEAICGHNQSVTVAFKISICRIVTGVTCPHGNTYTIGAFCHMCLISFFRL